ncbi:hypothetical protein F4821DRAFT_280034 [Hypoxylon rubiginosum]|uniref:Uncharacterized protein n=1 Tax=Hypoxylon rubiginosum TaxID=110542 RepID=A0ACC0CVD0_9PEZI|nr:hypothetical protein F4821DRAFT_280034 [Hypoxylon rubiginosum]
MKTAIFLSAMFGTLASCGLWAQFCDDMDCHYNCGESVSLDDSGCLSNEDGRQSVLFHGDDNQDYSLVFSPGADCNCQNDCADIGLYSEGRHCYYLVDRAVARSFRFQQEYCQSNNCPSQSVLGNRTATLSQA